MASLVLLAGDALQANVGHGNAVIIRSLAVVASVIAALVISRVAFRWSLLVIVVWQIGFLATSAPLVASASDLALTAVLLLPVLFYLTAPISVSASIAAGVSSSVVLLACYGGPAADLADILSLAMVMVGVNVAMSMVVIRIGRHRRLAFVAAQRFERASADLTASQALLERTFAAVRLPLLVTDVQTGVIVRANRAAEYLMTNALGALTGRRVIEFYPDPAERSAFVDALARKGSVSGFPVRLRRHDGKIRSVLLSAEKVAGGTADTDAPNSSSEYLVTAIIDRTEEELREDRIRASEAEYRALFENSVVGIYRSTPDGRMLRGNPALVALSGYEAETEFVALVNDIAQEWYVEPGRRDEFKRRMAVEGEVKDFVSEMYRHKTRERIWISESAWCIRDAQGEIVGYEGTVSEATERKRQEAVNAQLARHDPLTGLANRRLFDERLDQALARASRDGTFIAVLYLDIDCFKAVNDDHGHMVGDALLVEIARRLKASCRTEDTVVRYGGDEFVILQVGLEQPGSATVLAERILKVFDRSFDLEGCSLPVATSIGIAIAPANVATAHDLVLAADQALYLAKANGRGRFEIAPYESLPCSEGTVGRAKRSRDLRQG